MAHETTETAVRVDVPPYTRRQMKTCRPSFFGANQPHRSPHACNVRMIIASHHRAYRLATYTGIASWFRANGMRRFAWASSKPPDQPRIAGMRMRTLPSGMHAPLAERADSGVIMRTPVMSERRCQHGSHRLFALQAYAYATPIWSVPPRWGHGQRYPREGGWIRCSKTHPLLPACFQVTHPKILVCRAFSLSPFRHGRRQCRHHVWATAEGHASSHGPVGMGGFDDADRMHFAGIHAYMPLKAVLRGHRRRAGMNPSASPHSCFQAVGRPVSAAVPVWTACAHGGGAGRRIPIPLLPGGSRSTLAGARSHASMPACSQTRPSLPACFQVTRLKSMVFRSCGLQTPPRFGHVPTIASGRITPPYHLSGQTVSLSAYMLLQAHPAESWAALIPEPAIPSYPLCPHAVRKALH